MNFLLLIGNFIGSMLEKALPYLFIFMAGKKAAEHDFEKSLREVLEEDNEELRANSIKPDSAVADLLRERAARKRKDQD